MDDLPDIDSKIAYSHPEGVLRFCTRCGAELDGATQACSACDRKATAAARSDHELRLLRISAVLYGLYLASIIVVGFAFEPEARAVLVGDAITTLFVVGFAIGMRRMLVEQLRLRAAGKWFALATIAAPITYFIASRAVGFMHQRFAIPVEKYLTTFTDAGYGLWPAFISLCVVPPLIEELAFRGVILGGLLQVVDRRSAVIVSAVAFAILHLSIVSFPHLLLLGLLLGGLRITSGSLLPGMLLHLLHNGLCGYTEYLHG